VRKLLHLQAVDLVQFINNSVFEKSIYHLWPWQIWAIQVTLLFVVFAVVAVAVAIIISCRNLCLKIYMNDVMSISNTQCGTNVGKLTSHLFMILTIMLHVTKLPYSRSYLKTEKETL